MKRTDKKGFTIVELVIVIAVIAILAAVLIPNLSKMVRNAKESSDIQLIRNMNTAMQVESVGGTKRYDTAHDAITAATAAGYDLTKISLSDKENTILWDEENQCFAYLRKGETTPEYVPNSKKDNTNTPAEKLWKVYDVVPDDGFKYSVYWNGGDTETINVENLGFDAGTATIGTVNYTGNAGKTVVIRTNGGTLNITAPKDTVHHYDFVMTLSVESVSETHCYYEHGFVGTLAKFNSGKFVTTSTAQFFQTEEEISEVLSGKEVDFSVKPAYSQNKYDEEGISIINRQPGPNHVHKWDDGTVTLKPTCGVEGKEEYICTTCKLKEEKNIPATGAHTWGTDNKCTECGANKPDGDNTVTVVNTYLGLKTVIESVPEGYSLVKDKNGKYVIDETKVITFKLGANLATSKDSYILQSRNTVIKIDLNGHTLELYGAEYGEYEVSDQSGTHTRYGFTSGVVVRGIFTVTDSVGGGKIVAANNTDNKGDCGLILVEKTGGQSTTGSTVAKLVLESGTIDASNNPNGCAVMFWHGGEVEINGGTVKAQGYAISGSEKDIAAVSSGSKFNTKLVINGGEITSTASYAIYHPQCIKEKEGVFEINGGKIFGEKGAIYIGGNRSGDICKESGSKLTINGGELKSNSDHVIYVNSTYLGNGGSNAKVTLSIKGGTLEAGTSGASLVKVIANKGIRSSSGKYNNGSAGFNVYLYGGNYVNISKTNFVYVLDYESVTVAKEPTWKAAKAASTKYQINDNSDGTWSVNPVA